MSRQQRLVERALNEAGPSKGDVRIVYKTVEQLSKDLAEMEKRGHGGGVSAASMMKELAPLRKAVESVTRSQGFRFWKKRPDHGPA